MDLIDVFHISSVYYGVIIVYFAYYCTPNKLPYLLSLGLINASGTGLIGLMLVLTNRYWKKTNLFLLFFLVCAFLFFLYFTQLERGRNLFDIDSIDRVIILKAYLTYVYEKFTFDMILIGAGPVFNLVDMTIKMENQDIANYLILESGTITSKMLHNDLLRIFNTFGLSGLILFIIFIKKFIIQEMPLFLIFILMSFATTIWYVSSIMILIRLYSLPHASVKKGSL